jgi:hypothetical protein
MKHLLRCTRGVECASLHPMRMRWSDPQTALIAVHCPYNPGVTLAEKTLGEIPQIEPWSLLKNSIRSKALLVNNETLKLIT